MATGDVGDAADERTSLRLPPMRGLRARSEGVHAEVLRRLTDRAGVAGVAGTSGDRRGARLPVEATLVALPTTRPVRGIPAFDVLVEVAGQVVGRLPEGHAPVWHGPLCRAQERGVTVVCGAVLTVREGRPPAMSLRVCEPEHLRLMLTTPEWALPLVPECSVTLSGARFTAELLARVTRRMVDWVTLHPVSIGEDRHAGRPGVEVRLDGQRVGELSATAGARYRPIVDDAARRSKVPLARARLRIDERGAELEVLLPRPA